MKFLLVVLVILLAAWLWRSGRRRDGPRPPPAAADGGGSPQDMVACALCGVHVPRGEAQAGRRGAYCSAEHRQRAEP